MINVNAQSSFVHFVKFRLPGLTAGIDFNLLGNSFSLKTSILNFSWETISLLILRFLSDLSIIQANPTRFDLFKVTISEHSRADLPVVITSSTISTFEFDGILNPLLSINLPFNLSEKIVWTPSCLPISYPKTIPPIAG